MPPDRPSEQLVDLAEHIDRAGTLEQAAALVADYAVAHLDADLAGVTLRRPEGRVVRLAATSPMLVELDEVGVALDEGPGTQHLEAGSVIVIGDTRDHHPSWPRWSEAAAARGLRALRVVGMPPLQGRSVRLELGSHRPHGFAAEGLALVQGAARHAGLCLRHVDRVANLEGAMATRSLIGQAQGILMERHGLTGEQAMTFLRRSSQQSQVKVRELAERLVTSRETGAGLDLPPPVVGAPGPLGPSGEHGRPGP